jgi:hypothetical protein
MKFRTGRTRWDLRDCRDLVKDSEQSKVVLAVARHASPSAPLWRSIFAAEISASCNGTPVAGLIVSRGRTHCNVEWPGLLVKNIKDLSIYAARTEH